MTLVDIAAALVRTTLATSAAAIVAWALLTWLRVSSPRIHRVAWLMVILQGWLLLPWTIKVASSPPPPPPAISSVGRDTKAERGAPAFARRPNAAAFPLTNAQPPTPPHPIVLAPIAIAAWLLGAIALAAISLRRYLQLLRTLPLGSPPDDVSWQAEWQAARAAAKLRRRQNVDLRITTNLGPLLHWAPWAYFILVPRELWKTLASPQRQAILRHELAHLRRGDLWKSLAIRALALPQWFNPFAWLAVRRFDEAAEWACDDAAAASHAGPLDFANSLLASAEFAATPLFGGAPAARGALARRIHRLVSPRFKEESTMKLLLVPTLLAAIALAHGVRIEVIAAETPPVVRDVKPTSAAVEKGSASLDEQQRTFDLLTKEFEQFQKTPYVVEPPDVLSIHISHRMAPTLPPLLLEEMKKPDARKIRRIPDGIHTRRFHPTSRNHLYLVNMDGRVELSGRHSVYIAGMTLEEASAAIRRRLVRDDPSTDVEVNSSVDRYNSRVYFVITSEAPFTDEVARWPIPHPVDGKEDVATALSRLGQRSVRPGNFRQLSTASITLRRPATAGGGAERAFRIIWDAATRAPTPLTNHRLHPADRLFVDFDGSEDQGDEPAGARADVKPPAKFAPRSTDNEATREYPIPDSNGSNNSSVAPARREVSPSFLSGSNIQPPPSNARVDVDPSYQIQPYDTFSLRVHRPRRPKHALSWGDVEAEFTVTSDGTIGLGAEPGELRVAGMTALEASDAIQRKLAAAAPDCSVALEFVCLASQKFFISMQHPDGTEVAAGSLPAGQLSEVLAPFDNWFAEISPDVEMAIHRDRPRGLTLKTGAPGIACKIKIPPARGGSKRNRWRPIRRAPAFAAQTALPSLGSAMKPPPPRDAHLAARR